MHILILEDEPKIASFLRRGLSEEGHMVEAAADLRGARELLGKSSFDLLLVDRMLPDGDGLSLVRELRRAGSQTPVLCLTARDRVEERVEGLNGGADDYLVKPFSIDELLARVAALARRSGLAGGRVSVGDLEVDLDALRVWRAGAEVRLTAQEFRLLRALAEHPGHIVSRTRLLESAWDLHHDPGTNVVDVYVGYLRAKIDRGHARPLIHTVRGLGYVLEDRDP